jgi:hypothetical protein
MANPRPDRIVDAALRCYPEHWRARHGDEACELAASLAGDGVPLWSIALSYLGGAARERLASRAGRRFRVAAAAIVMLAGPMVGLATTLLASAPAGAEGVVRAYIINRADAAEELEAVFASHHVNIVVAQEPVSPSLVGSIVGSTVPGLLTSNHVIIDHIPGPCAGGAYGCTEGVLLPSHFTGRAQLDVGRRAGPGEIYADAASIFRPGEILACSAALGRTVGSALPALERLRMAIIWEVGDIGDLGGGETDATTEPSRSNYVLGGKALSSSAISILIAPTGTSEHSSMDLNDRHC